MEYIPMHNEMRELLNATIRVQSSKGIELTPDYYDEGARNTLAGDRVIFSAYTPWGVYCIEETFRYRMKAAHAWDSKDLIRRDILTNPHIHTSIKEKLLDAYEKTDWARWYDGLFAQIIMGGGEAEATRQQIKACSYLTDASRDNLLYNVDLRNAP